MADLSAWAYYKEIAIKADQVDANLTDFPLLVQIETDADLAKARADGYDIRFTLDDGTTELKYQRLSWVGGGGGAVTANFWVKIPSVSMAVSTSLRIYYGNATAGEGEDAESVWDGNYRAVLHLSEAGVGAADEYIDSSGNDNHGQGGAGVLANTPDQVNGVIYKAQSFVVANADRIKVPDDDTLDVTTAISIEAWIKQDRGTWAGIFGRLSDKYRSPTLYFHKTDGYVKYYGDIGGVSRDLTVGSSPPDLTWIHVALTYDDVDDTVRAFLDGAVDGTVDTYNGEMTASATDLYIGNRGAGDRPFGGLMEEYRFSSIARPVEWWKFQHANVTSDDNELSFGTEQVSVALETNARSWCVISDIVREILAADEYRDEYTIQLQVQFWNGTNPVYLGFDEDAVIGVGARLGGIGDSVRVTGAKARKAVSAVSAEESSGGIELHTSLEYRHTRNYPDWAQWQPKT